MPPELSRGFQGAGLLGFGFQVSGEISMEHGAWSIGWKHIEIVLRTLILGAGFRFRILKLLMLKPGIRITPDTRNLTPEIYCSGT
jgi:hypothetical protein